MEEEKQRLNAYLKQHGLKKSVQRERILEIFLEIENHLTAEELLEHVKKKYPEIGYSTVYRSLNLMVKAGLARVVDIGDGSARFEHAFRHGEHDHLICERCGKLIEFKDPRCKPIIDEVAEQKKFVVKRHRLDIFGICSDCIDKAEEE